MLLKHEGCSPAQRRRLGYRDTRYPVCITRNRAWSSEVKLLTSEEVGEGFLQIPAGPFIYGEGRETTTKELPDFAIGEFPVTFAEYGQFREFMTDATAALNDSIAVQEAQ